MSDMTHTEAEEALVSGDEEDVAEAIASEEAEAEQEIEDQFVERIGNIWSQHNKRTDATKLNRSELEQLRKELSAKLHAYKKLLAGSGRDGIDRYKRADRPKAIIQVSVEKKSDRS